MVNPASYLSQYFDRIGFSGEPSATVETLTAIHLLHPGAIPFENLNPLFRIPVVLTIESIQEKLVQRKRGGYCFEHNLLLKDVLEAIGFKVKGLSARVLWNVPDGVITPRGHMLLLLEIDRQQYIADVGFGGLTLTAPLLLKHGAEQSTPHEVFRLIQAEDEFTLQVKIKAEWKPVYRFSLQEQFQPDYEVPSWYLSNHPASHFVTGLIAARTTTTCRYALRNNQFAIHDVNGTTEKRTIASIQELKALLQDVFQIDLPNIANADPILSKIVEPAAATV